MRTGSKIFFATALLVGLGAWYWQWQSVARLRSTIVNLRRANAEVPVARARLATIVAGRNKDEAARQVRGEIAQLQQEIEAWKKALASLAAPRASFATPGKPEDHYTDNRDPEKGPVRVEHFRNAGQATPAAAFQTAIWAVQTGADDAWPTLLAISPAGREKLRAMVERLTPSAQAQYRPPEKIVGLLLATDFLQEEGFAILETSEPDATGQVTLVVRRVRNGRKDGLDKKVPFVPTPAGWALPITDKMIDSIPSGLAERSMYVPPKTGAAAASP